MLSFPRCELHLGMESRLTKLIVGGEDLQKKLPIKRIAIEVLGDKSHSPRMHIECYTSDQLVEFNPQTVLAALKAEVERIERLMKEAEKRPVNSLTIG
jgi:hypothetical protein